MPHMNLERARKVMQEKGLDVLIASTQHNFYYASGYKPRVSDRPMMVIIPADSDQNPFMIVGSFIERQARQNSKIVEEIHAYPMWVCQVNIEDIESHQSKPIIRPAQFDETELYILLANLLKQKGLIDCKIGLEKNILVSSNLCILQKEIPGANYVEAESTFWDLRKIKTPEEIEILRISASLAENGIQGMIQGDLRGLTIGELQRKYKVAVLQGAEGKGPIEVDFLHLLISSGDPVTNEIRGYQVKEGDILFIDNGAQIDGYNADMGRTFVIGKPNEQQKNIHAALLAGYEAGLSRVKAGVPMNEIYHAVHDTIRKNGLDWFARGHVGHMVGVGVGPGHIEQPPILSAKEEAPLEANMVITVEIGTYINGFGAFQIEDEMVVTDDGYELLTNLSRDLVEL